MKQKQRQKRKLSQKTDVFKSSQKANSDAFEPLNHDVNISVMHGTIFKIKLRVFKF